MDTGKRLVRYGRNDFDDAREANVPRCSTYVEATAACQCLPALPGSIEDTQHGCWPADRIVNWTRRFSPSCSATPGPCVASLSAALSLRHEPRDDELITLPALIM